MCGFVVPRVEEAGEEEAVEKAGEEEAVLADVSLAAGTQPGNVGRAGGMKSMLLEGFAVRWLLGAAVVAVVASWAARRAKK